MTALGHTADVIPFPRRFATERETAALLSTEPERAAWNRYVAAMDEFETNPTQITAGALLVAAVTFESLWINHAPALALSVFDTVARIADGITARGVPLVPVKEWPALRPGATS